MNSKLKNLTIIDNNTAEILANGVELIENVNYPRLKS